MKKAFTMIELVFVIVIVGIISVMIAPNFQGNNLRQAADQLVSHIRYTQHLAMMDNKFSTNDATWFQLRWQLVFGSNANTGGVPAYTIFSDSNKNNNADITEMAINPLDTTKRLSGGYSGTLATTNTNATQTMNIGQEYGIDTYQLNGGCSGARVAFDYLGRPITGNVVSMTGPYSALTQRLITSTCSIVLSNSDSNITIQIEPETGYTHIL
jgi:prepilin-type N-terminal cleavage/methylation domain-containing protein